MIIRISAFEKERSRRMKKRNMWLVSLMLFSIAALVLAGCGTPKLGTEDNPIVMSFVPSGDTQEIIASGDQLAEMITEKTDLVVEANVGTDFAAVREAMGAGKAHIGWLNTFNYVLANEKYGVDVALVTERFGSTSYKGQFNVRADSGITELEDIKGKVMCWVDPNSTSGYIIPRIMLAANGIDPDADFAKTVEAGSHNNSVTAVYNGDCDVGVSYADARSSIEEDFADVKEVVVVLATTTDIPNDSVSFAKEFDAEMRDQIVNALLEISASEEGQEALNNLYSIDALQAADDSFYDGFRADLSKAGMDIEELAK
jgi:phosphonate transport system substrate-binding protein